MILPADFSILENILGDQIQRVENAASAVHDMLLAGENATVEHFKALATEVLGLMLHARTVAQSVIDIKAKL